jgi:hypothetical protein
MQPTTIRKAAPYVAAGVALQALVLTPPVNDGGVLYPIIVLLGPLASGVIAGRKWRPVAATWALFATIMFVDDFLLGTGNQGFHLVLGVLMVGLCALGAAAGRLARRVRPA